MSAKKVQKNMSSPTIYYDIVVVSSVYHDSRTQYDRSVSNGQKVIFYPLILELKNTTFGFFLIFYDVMHHIPCKF